jgi:hypothetical protein
MVSTLPITIIAVLVVWENKDLFYQLGVCYQISLQLRLAAPQEVPIIASSMKKENKLIELGEIKGLKKKPLFRDRH